MSQKTEILSDMQNLVVPIDKILVRQTLSNIQNYLNESSLDSSFITPALLTKLALRVNCLVNADNDKTAIALFRIKAPNGLQVAKNQLQFKNKKDLIKKLVSSKKLVNTKSSNLVYQAIFGNLADSIDDFHEMLLRVPSNTFDTFRSFWIHK